MDLKKNQKGFLLKHLGHSVAVHNTYYKMLSSTIELAKVAKFLLLKEEGQLHKLEGKDLDSIEYEGMFELCLSSC